MYLVKFGEFGKFRKKFNSLNDAKNFAIKNNTSAVYSTHDNKLIAIDVGLEYSFFMLGNTTYLSHVDTKIVTSNIA